MDLPDFVRFVSERLDRMSWFLGAGASQSAGLPTAWDVMWYLKRRFYCTEENQSVAANDLQNPAVLEEINQFLEARSFPKPGDSLEYSRCFELIFADDYKRQQEFLAAMLGDSRISLTQGHRAFAALIVSGLCKTVFTTNFDGVVEKAVAAVGGKSLSPFHLEGSYAVRDALNAEAFPILCKLHGDFRYRSLKNLSVDLAQQNEDLAAGLKIACNRFGLIVVGYSGRDQSVMAALADALEGGNPFPHGLFWLTMKGRKPLPEVEAFLDRARIKGVQAELVEIETFDSLLARIWNQIPNRDPELISKVGRAPQHVVSIAIPDTGTQSPLVRTNALPVVMPSQCMRLEFTNLPETAELDKIENESTDPISVVKADGAVWAWGAESALRAAFGQSLTGIASVDISARLSDYSHNLFLKRLTECSLGLSLSEDLPLAHRRWREGSILIVKDGGANEQLKNLAQVVHAISGDRALTGVVPNLRTVPTDSHPEPRPVRWAEALELRLEEVNGNYWILVRPQIWIWPPRSRRDAEAFLDSRRSRRFNDKTDALMSAWIKSLLPSSKRGENHVLRPYGIGTAAGHPQFCVNDRTAFSRKAPV